jgi:hypothetical protein
MKKSLLTIIFLAAFPCYIKATTYYVCDTGATCGTGWSTGNDSNAATSKSSPAKTISGGISKMLGGDTLIIGSGTYSGNNNFINYYLNNKSIPSGTSGAWTTVRAEVDGEVTINGGSNQNYTTVLIMGNQPVDGTAFSPDVSNTRQNYIQLRGVNVTTGSLTVTSSKYIKIINCGVVDGPDGNNVNMGVSFSEYVLFEGCYAWGGGRYKFLSFHSHYGIFRNCVGRLDYASTQNDPIATFSMYSSTNIEVQNAIDVDSDTGSWTGIERPYGAFFNPSTSATTYQGPIIWTNCIALNNKLGFGASDYNSYPVDAKWRNSIGWAISPLSGIDVIHTQGNADIQQSTFGNITISGSSAPFWNGWKNGNSQTNKNNILVNISGAPHITFYDIETNSYNGIYNSGGSPYSASGSEPSNIATANPLTSSCLKYLPRLESGCSLAASGQSGARLGAEILYQYGKTGTLWGESGYNLLQDGTNGQALVAMWPFPNENLIKAKMSAYSNHGVNGARGFCTGNSKDGSPQTLTKYIWEYLGNQIPSNIYGSSRPNAPNHLCELDLDGKCKS